MLKDTPHATDIAQRVMRRNSGLIRFVLPMVLLCAWASLAQTPLRRTEDTVFVDRLQQGSSLFEYPVATRTVGAIVSTLCIAYDDSALSIGIVGNWPINLRLRLDARDNGWDQGFDNFETEARGIDTMALSESVVIDKGIKGGAERRVSIPQGNVRLAVSYDPSASGKRADRRFKMSLRFRDDPTHDLTLERGNRSGLQVYVQTDMNERNWEGFFEEGTPKVIVLR